MQVSTVYVVYGDSSTYGVYKTEMDAQSRICELYHNGYFGSLDINEDELVEA